MTDLTSPRNPSFLGARYLGPECEVYDERDTKQQFTLSERAVPFGGWTQRWSMIIPLVNERGQLSPRLLNHQEVNQLDTAFWVPVPQDGDVSNQIGPSPVTLIQAASALTNVLAVDIPIDTTINPHWFFSFPNHNKVYTANFLSPYESSTNRATNPFVIYPDLRKDVPNGTALNMWPSMRCYYNSFFSMNEATLEKRETEILTINVTEALFG